MQIEFISGSFESTAKDSAVALLAFENVIWSDEARSVERHTGGAISRALEVSTFKGARGEILELIAPTGLIASRILLVGAGARDEGNDLAIEQAAARSFKSVRNSGARTLDIHLAGAPPAQAARAAFGALLAAYRFDKYRTREKAAEKTSITSVRIMTREPDAARAEFSALAPLAEAIYFTRDLVSEPPNILFPVEFARRVKALEKIGLVVEILGAMELTDLKMGALLSIGQGSRRESQLVVIRWNGGAADQPPVAFIGKGVCFDAGGISLKKPAGMDAMKWDMAGAAAVTGVLHALAGRKARVNAVGILGLVENMPDGNALRPGDVVTSMSGQTIEIISTDAEGRVVLADALWYCQQRFKPRVMVDVATLTGASQVALGVEYAALFSNDEDLAAELIAAGKAEEELLWQLPLSQRLEKQLESSVADLKNLGEPAGGAIVAALFVQRFVNKFPWAHLDITPTVWPSPSTFPTIPDGASGFAVRLLNRWVADRCES